MDNYNGWANYNTWNVAFWLGNDMVFIKLLKEVMDIEIF